MNQGRSKEEARKVERRSKVYTGLLRPAGQPLRYRRAPHPVIFETFSSSYTPANGHRFVGWRGEIMTG
ncbi:Bgt-60041 [Blumeria graminis f. sp. tritici]|uniref:Bgt-60041 n=1 Tax=Blumeria graminis f. sp. tritici TaxID=62690 RepID=A0A9X9MFP9_BLUGR|nr:Bgt-60041 [Blumeria graminis f. sp. tritici]